MDLYFSENARVSYLEEQVKEWVNGDSEISKKINSKCTSVKLISESKNKYRGYAEFFGGRKVDVTVTGSPSSGFIMQADAGQVALMRAKDFLENIFDPNNK